MTNQIKEAVALIKSAKHAIAFTGAGVSVESGIPPFRGEDGLWSKYNPNTLDLSIFHKYPEEAWLNIKEIFYDFFGKATPNKAHEVLARMEKDGFLKAIITQNIDNLHQEAGSRNVIEFHGSAHNMICTKCKHQVASNSVDLSQLPPHCNKCHAILKPDFVFFGEGIPQSAYDESFRQADLTDLIIIIGTTGEVMPACSIPNYAKARGAKIIEINPSSSAYTNSVTNLYLKGKAGVLLEQIEQELFA